MDQLSPLKARSLKQHFIDRFEELILSGHFPVGNRLPPERELAKMLQVSRPVVHEGLVELSARGLVTILPRRGTVVNDFRHQGSVELLGSLLNHGGGDLQPGLLKGVLEMRLLFEGETARLAAQLRSDDDLRQIGQSLALEEKLMAGQPPRKQPEAFARGDYQFHHTLALSSGNMVYPLLMNSFRQLYLGILERFYRGLDDFSPILRRHRAIVSAINLKDGPEAAEQMTKLLQESEVLLEKMMGMEQ